MSCSSCAAQAAAMRNTASMVQPNYRVSFVEETEPCDYTMDHINLWLVKVKCFKDSGHYITYPSFSKRVLNAYIGVLLSANYKQTNICYYKSELEKIESFVMFMTNLGLC